MNLISIILTILIINCFRKPDGNLYCGLIGGSCSKTPLDILKLKTLFLDNIERGEDSTGFYDGKELWKEPGKANKVLLPFDLIDHNSTLFIGHTRKRTIGVANKENAHPFKFTNSKKKVTIIGAHNGTLQSWDKLREYYDFDNKEVDMDSKVIFKALAEHNSCRIFEDFTGALATIFTKGDDKLYVWRNSDRPLFWGYINVDGDVTDRQMYISSLKEGLLGIGCKNVKEFKTECLYIIENGKIKTTKKIRNKNAYTYYELGNLIRKKNNIPEVNNKTNKTNAYKDTNIGLRNRVVNPAMDKNSTKSPFAKNAIIPSSRNDHSLNINEGGGICALPSDSRFKTLDNYFEETDDNYGDEDKEVLENNEDIQDLKSEYAVEKLPFKNVNNITEDFDDIVKSGMQEESLFLISQKVYLYLKEIGKSIDKCDETELYHAKDTLVESLNSSADRIGELLMESIKI